MLTRRLLLGAGAGLLAGAQGTMPSSRMARLKSLGLELPQVPQSLGAYQPFTRHGSLIFVAGQIAVVSGVVLHPGRVPDQIPIEAARAAARRCALQLLSVASTACGGLEKIGRVLRIDGFVQAGSGFDRHPEVINAASELLVAVLGPDGSHSRTAVGVSSLPRNACVEIAAVLTSL